MSLPAYAEEIVSVPSHEATLPAQPRGGYIHLPHLFDSIDDPFAEVRWTARACRIINIGVALLGLILALPLMIVIAAAIRLTSSGPIFFKQTRVGIDRRHPDQGRGHWRRRTDYGGKPFTMYKFRTMTHSAGSDAQVWATPDDPRVTSVGRFLRLHRLDELPQLVNVLKGDMNIVGPRPEQPEIFDQLRGEISRYQVRQRVRPGITGWAQINHRYDQDISDVQAKLKLDLEYIQSRHPFRDLQIMARTFPVMVGRRGAW